MSHSEMLAAVPALLLGTFACGSVGLDRDAGSGADSPGGDGPGPTVDASGPIGDAPGPTCDFASAGNACVFPPHVPTEQLRTCFTAATQPALRPPVGATVVFRKSGSTYQLDCTPNCGGSITTIAAQEALFQMNAPLVEVFCLSSINIPAGVAVTADGSFDRAIAALASDTITIGGTIDVSGGLPQDPRGGAGGPGGYAGGSRIPPVNGQGPCGGAGGATQGSTSMTGGGGGGGGHVGTGGNGGAANPAASGGAGGCTVPYGKLEGGSGGGTGGSGTVINHTGTPNFEENFAGSGGGGALALISRRAVTVTGSITANGAPGTASADNSSFTYDALGGTGGGAGGMIVLAALSVDVSGPLHVEGGKGAVSWGVGGAGATGGNTSGGNGANAPAANNGGAGGGGAGGFVRIMAASGTASCATIASPVGGCANSPLPSTPPGP